MSQQNLSEEVKERRRQFADVMIQLIVRLSAKHPERFNAMYGKLAKFTRETINVEVSPEAEAEALLSEYTVRLSTRGIIFLDELLCEACLHIGIEPSLEVLFDHIGALSEADLLQRVLNSVKMDIKLQNDPQMKKMADALALKLATDSRKEATPQKTAP